MFSKGIKPRVSKHDQLKLITIKYQQMNYSHAILVSSQNFTFGRSFSSAKNFDYLKTAAQRFHETTQIRRSDVRMADGRYRFDHE